MDRPPELYADLARRARALMETEADADVRDSLAVFASVWAGLAEERSAVKAEQEPAASR